MKVISNKLNIIRILVIIFLLIILSVSFVNFEKTSHKIIKTTSTQSLKETAEFYANTFAMKINDQLSMLESQARYFRDVDMTDYATLKKTIMSTKGIGEFKRIAVANSSGMTINYQGTTSGNIYLTEYFTKTIASGKPHISKNITVDEDGENVLVLAVPIIQNEIPVGVITGTFSYKILGDLFSVQSFRGNGYSLIVSNEGQLIVGSSKNVTIDASGNVLDYAYAKEALSKSELINIRNDMYMNKSDFFNLKLNGEELICCYTPVGVNNWYVFSFVTASYVKRMQFQISKAVYILVGIIFIVFAVILLIVTKVLRESEEAIHDIKNYQIASYQNSSVIFDYDLKSHTLKFSGNYEVVFGKIKNPIDVESFRMLYSRVHEDDKNVIVHLQEAVAKGQEAFSGEVRYNCLDNEYRWFRLSGTTMYDKDFKPVQFLGNFMDVSAQMYHEQELRHLAETDLLSGLLNKSFFQKNVVKFLSNANENVHGAFFIIDLDNFKETNDTLGHAMGDIAIRDTAQKITLIFSQKDIIGRIGGDEFCVFLRLDNVSQEVCSRIINEKANILCESLQEYYNNDVASVHISASIGIALYPESATDYQKLYRNADAALYNVKQNGKCNYAIYTEDMKHGDESFYE